MTELSRSLERTTGKPRRFLVNSGSVLACPWSLSVSLLPGEGVRLSTSHYGPL